MYGLNLQRLAPPSEKLARSQRQPTAQQQEHNNNVFEWTVRQAYRCLPKSVVDLALTNRRSEFSDEALMKDFEKFEQPYHEIPKDACFNKAVEVTRTLFKPHRMLNPVAYPDLRYYPANLTTAVEAPWNIKGWRFRPFDRNVDLESELPKVSIDLQTNWQTLFSELRWTMLKRKLFLNFDDTMDVDDWLALKMKHGLIKDVARSKHNLYNEVFLYNRFLIHQIKDGDPPFYKGDEPQTYYHNTLHARSHVVAANEQDKIRAVFGASWLMLMAELIFIWPLQHIYQNFPQDGKLFWGREIMRGGWKKIYREVFSKGIPNTVISIDWSSFDKRLLFELMDYVHAIWRSYFNFEMYEPTYFYNYGRNEANPTRITRLWNWMTHSVKHNPILLPDGSLWKWRRNGFGSGYQQTQLMDTFANAIMLLTCLSALGVDITADGFWIILQGDDSVTTFHERMFSIYGTGFLDAMADAADFYFNAKLSNKKSMISDRLNRHTALGYVNILGMPFRTSEDLLRHLLFPETSFNSYDRQVSVLVGLAYASCGTNQEFFNFCRYTWEKLIQKGAKPQEKYLQRGQWFEKGLQRMDFNVDEFPDRHKILDKLFDPHIRTDFEKQRVWPTRAGPRGRFYFIRE
jgi:hypothetical protein